MRFGWSEPEGAKMASTTTQTIATGTVVRVDFGSFGRGEYVAKVTGFQEGHIGLYELVWLETIPGYMWSGSVDLIEAERVSAF